jgi:hypothetical protein
MLRTHPFIDERETAADEVGLRLQELVGELLPQAIPDYASLDEPSAGVSGNSDVYRSSRTCGYPPDRRRGPKKDPARRARSRSVPAAPVTPSR